MSEWITDRKPTTVDSKGHRVWAMYFGAVLMTDIENVVEGQPWMPITPPEPYEKPKRYEVKIANDIWPDRYVSGYVVYAAIGGIHADRIPTHEAAERIAAIYEEVMP